MKRWVHWLGLLVMTAMLSWIDFSPHDWRIDVLSWAIVVFVWTDTTSAVNVLSIVRKVRRAR